LTNTGAVGLVSKVDTWIDADMKETDLTFVKIGDPVAIRSHGSEHQPNKRQPPTCPKCDGNWVKVVQRGRSFEFTCRDFGA
jgi:hypothetical protein